jgi:hypothetical protein
MFIVYLLLSGIVCVCVCVYVCECLCTYVLISHTSELVVVWPRGHVVGVCVCVCVCVCVWQRRMCPRDRQHTHTRGVCVCECLCTYVHTPVHSRPTLASSFSQELLLHLPVGLREAGKCVELTCFTSC